MPLRLPRGTASSQVSFELGQMDHGSRIMALGSASALLKSPKINLLFSSPDSLPSLFSP